MYKNVLIALDESEAAERALHRAIAMAEIEKGDLFVVVVNEGLPLFASIVWGGFKRLRQNTGRGSTEFGPAASR
jgi:nucleotide-binding universal stress UspA family protein